MKKKARKNINGKLINFGFDPSKIEIKPEDWKAGAIAQIILKEDGDWGKFLPLYEPQSTNSFDTYGCTCFGSLNQIEVLLNFLEGKEYNFSERYPYNIVGIEPPGANPNDVYQAMRHNGLLSQEELPFCNTLSEFKTPRPMTEELKNKGKLWLNDYELEHEWLVSPTHEEIAKNLKYSPIAISVTAWFMGSGGLYVDNGQPNTHWCLAFKAYPDGRIDVFDSYDHKIKTLDPKHKIMFAKRISIKKKPDPIVEEYKKENHYLVMVKKAFQLFIDIITFKWL